MVESKIPRIAFTCYYEKTEPEWEFRETDKDNLKLFDILIEKFGGKLIYLKYDDPLDEIIDKFDGWLIAGGPDIPPEGYGEKKHEKTLIYPNSLKRFNFEKSFFEKADKQMPILGICYGCQLLNVLYGGTLIQHIDHHEKHISNQIRELEILDSTLMRQCLGQDKFKTKCSHHQACKDIAPGFIVNCRDSEHKEIVHGIELKEGRWVLGTQFHPERLIGCDTNEVLFKILVEKSKEYRNKKEIASMKTTE